MNESVPAIEHPFADLVGLEVVGRGEGACTTALTVRDEHRNPHGVVHGAVIYALADTGMGGALTSVLEEGKSCSTIEIKINYFRPGVGGRLICETRVINRSRKTGAMESDVRDEVGRLLARATGTFMIIEREVSPDI